MRLLCLSLPSLLAVCLAAQSPPGLQAVLQAKALLVRAEEALKHGDRTNALTFATQAIEAQPNRADSWMFRGRLRAAMGRHAEAAGDFAKVVELDPRNSEAYLDRGIARFRQGHVGSALRDFDRAVQLAPDRGPACWPRGLALCLKGRWADARRQFEDNRGINTNDVEVAAWHFLSVAKTEGLERARATLFPVAGDTRVPMAEVHRLLAGEATPEAVLAAAQAGSVPVGEVGLARFYAELYLGVYWDATGHSANALAHLRSAAGMGAPFGLIGDVARFYADRVAEGIPAAKEEAVEPDTPGAPRAPGEPGKVAPVR